MGISVCVDHLLQPQLSCHQQYPVEPGLGAVSLKDLHIPSVSCILPRASALEDGLLELPASVVFLGLGVYHACFPAMPRAPW